MATNFEYYRDEMLKIARIDTMPAMVGGKLTRCCDTDCGECDFDGRCRQKRIEWLYAEHIEQPKLTKQERAFCEYMGDGYVARDQDGNLNWYDLEPSKEEETDDIYGEWRSRAGCYAINAKKSTFAFITWSNEKPWAVEDLLKLEVE